jgi:catechol 2,3-dioxygenase-like lactoylglutathione lyase family enzyme
MIDGAHIILYSRDPEADRAFFRDVLRFDSVDAGHGWLIFALPPAEAAFHGWEKHGLEKESSEEDDEDQNDLPEKARHELYFMCDDITATLGDLKKKNVPVSAVNEQRWGSIATLTLPSGGKVGIYEPKHPRPKHL